MTEQEIYAQIPRPPEGSAFTLLKVQKVTTPHPYCITPKHVAVAADHHCGMLNEAAIEDAEKRGARCGTCREMAKRNRDSVLSYREHETNTALFIQVPQDRNLNAVQGLHAYLLSIKALAESLGVTGFAFPTAKEAQ
jgi:hypothetical protein